MARNCLDDVEAKFYDLPELLLFVLYEVFLQLDFIVSPSSMFCHFVNLVLEHCNFLAFLVNELHHKDQVLALEFVAIGQQMAERACSLRCLVVSLR